MIAATSTSRTHRPCSHALFECWYLLQSTASLRSIANTYNSTLQQMENKGPAMTLTVFACRWLGTSNKHRSSYVAAMQDRFSLELTSSEATMDIYTQELCRLSPLMDDIQELMVISQIALMLLDRYRCTCTNDSYNNNSLKGIRCYPCFNKAMNVSSQHHSDKNASTNGEDERDGIPASKSWPRRMCIGCISCSCASICVHEQPIGAQYRKHEGRMDASQSPRITTLSHR